MLYVWFYVSFKFSLVRIDTRYSAIKQCTNIDLHVYYW